MTRAWSRAARCSLAGFNASAAALSAKRRGIALVTIAPYTLGQASRLGVVPMSNPFHSAARKIESLDRRSATAKRIRTEGRICEALVSAILDASGTISVYDGEEWPLRRSADKAAIIAAMFSTDEDMIQARDLDGAKLGNFHLVYGNDGIDVIGDHTANDYCESIMAAIKPVIDREEAAFC